MNGIYETMLNLHNLENDDARRNTPKPPTLYPANL